MPVSVKRPVDRLGRSLVVANALTRDTWSRPDFEGISLSSGGNLRNANRKTVQVGARHFGS